MRIIYLHQYFVTPQGSSGTRSYEFARRLVKNGHSVTMITSSAFLNNEFPCNGNVLKCMYEGIQLVVLPLSYDNSMSFANRIRSFLKFAFDASREILRFPTDVIFATSTPLTIAIPAIVGKLGRRCPLVFEVRDLWPEVPIAMGVLKNPVLKLAARSLEWLAYHASSEIIALSPGMADGICRRGIRRERISLIPNSCDLLRFAVPESSSGPIRAKLGLKPEHKLIIYTGTFGVANGVSYLVELAYEMSRISSNVRFLLVGGGAEKEKITKLAKQKKVLNRTLWIWDFVPKTEVPALFAAASVVTSLFIPLRELWHNSANKFFDGLAAGKPVVINYGGWQADLLQETGAGIALDPNDPAKGAGDLAEFLHNENRLIAAGHAAKALAQTRFDREEMARKFENVLLRAVNPNACEKSKSAIA